MSDIRGCLHWLWVRIKYLDQILLDGYRRIRL
jgi:hypothetical protein